jgi:hypothetical protein
MALARAFTMRVSKRDTSSTPPPIRTGSVRLSGKAIDRNLISHPVALLSTTNMLSYNAPDISSLKSLRKASSSVSSGSSHASEDDSDGSSAANRSRNTYQTDASSVDNSPTTSPGNHDSASYFSTKSRKSTPRRSISTSDLKARSKSPTPEIPQRAPSHSKKAHERVARKSASQQFRSHSSTQSWLSVPTAREQRESLEIFSNKVDSVHPLGKELNQLDEVAEEFNDTLQTVDVEADADVMKRKNLGKFRADDYIAEIRPLYLWCFEPKLLTVGPGGWI